MILLLLGLMLQCSSAAFFSYSEGNIAHRLMNSCIPLPHQHIKLFFLSYFGNRFTLSMLGGKKKRKRKQFYCSRMFADMWNRQISGFLLCNWWAVNFTDVLGNFCKAQVQPDLPTSDCCQILNRFTHSHRSHPTLATTPAGKESQ